MSVDYGRSSGVTLAGKPKSDRVKLKEVLIGELLLKLFEYVDKHPIELTLVEAALYSLVLSNQSRGIKTHAKVVPEYMHLSPATISRRLNALTNRGYLSRELVGGVYYYSTPERNDEDHFVLKDGRPITEDIFETIVGMLNRAVED